MLLQFFRISDILSGYEISGERSVNGDPGPESSAAPGGHHGPQGSAAGREAAANAAICARLLAMPCFQKAENLLLYAAFGGEVDLAVLAEQAARLGKTVAYPVCGENFTLTAAVPGPDGWEVGAYGIRTPVLERAALIRPEALDLVLVPCTAFDAACRRVGMGKGYYDRYLPRCRNAVALGVAFEAQRVPEAAADEQDRRLDGFVTERKVYRGTDEFEL